MARKRIQQRAERRLAWAQAAYERGKTLSRDGKGYTKPGKRKHW